MILHIGGNNVVFIRDIVAIIDKESMNSSRINRDMLARVQREKRLIDHRKDTASYIVVEKNGEQHFYCSSISCGTLQSRCSFLSSVPAARKF